MNITSKDFDKYSEEVFVISPDTSKDNDNSMVKEIMKAEHHYIKLRRRDVTYTQLLIEDRG